MTTTRVRSGTLDGLLRLRHPTQVAIAHDGSLLAFTMTEAARERDGADRTRVWLMQPNGDRALVIIPGAAHSLVTCLNRGAFFHATRAFLMQESRAVNL